MLLRPTDETIAQCAEVLRSGGVVGMPTETVYGIAASLRNDDGIRRIFSVKGRPADNPLIVHVGSIDDACALTQEAYREDLRAVASVFWPGPLTCVVPAAPSVTPLVTAGLSTVAVRMPKHPVALALIQKLGCPVAAPSANRSGRPSPTTAQHVIDDLGDAIDVLDGGPCEIGLESTVVRLEADGCTVLRPGSISRQQLLDALHRTVGVASSQDDLRASPGTRYRHYAPNCPVVICPNEASLKAHVAAYHQPIMVLAERTLSELPEYVVAAILQESTLYAELRRAEDLQLEAILVLCDEAVQRREALMNRLASASAPHKEV